MLKTAPDMHRLRISQDATPIANIVGAKLFLLQNKTVANCFFCKINAKITKTTLPPAAGAFSGEKCCT